MNRREFLSAGLQIAGNSGGPPPHVLILVADGMGGSHTPNIDALAARGVRLERFHIFPLSSATRAALLTGRSPARQGLLGRNIEPFDDYGLPPEERTMADAFRAAGYETAICGKWHLGHARRAYLPGARGFEHSYGCLNGRIDSTTHEREGGVDWHRDGKTVREAGHAADLIAAEAVRLIRGRDPSRPLFLYVPFPAPGVDAAAGRMLEALGGMEFNTIVLFFADSGRELSPAVMKWPGRLKQAAVYQQPVTVMDVFPTLAIAAGVKPGNTLPLDGRPMLRSIVTGEPAPRGELFLGTVLFEGPWKLAREGTRDHLFRMEEETRNVAADHPDVVKDLGARMDRWRALDAKPGIRKRVRAPRQWAEAAR